MADQKLFLLDAYALIFRAYYAFIRNPRISSKGMNTSAMFGFVNVLEEVLRNQKPSHIAVVFDHKSPNVRVQEFPFYKANRQETPEDIRASEPWIRKIIEAYNIPILESPGYEADDVIGTLAKVAEKEGYQVFMMTPDKDFGQLVSENIFMYKPGRQGKPAEILGVPEVCEKFQVESPLQVIDILGLMGDAVDNIPGIPGVGEKTAIKLISQFGSVEEMYKRTEELKGKLKEKVEANQQQAIDSKKLATILLDAPVPFEPEKLVLEEANKKELGEIFSELEFRTIGKRIIGEEFKVNVKSSSGQRSLFGGDSTGDSAPEPVAAGKNIENTEHTYHCVDTPKRIQDLVKLLSKQKSITFDTETSGLNSHNTDIVGLSFSIKAGEAYYVPCSTDYEEAKMVVKAFESVFEDEKIEKVAHNIKFDIQILRLYDVIVKGPIYDTMVAHYVSNSNIRHKMDIMSEAYLGYTPVPIEDLIGKRGKNQKSMRDVPVEQVTEYAAEDADITLQLKPIVEKMVSEVEGEKLLNEVEFPLIYVLSDMECEGISLDTKFLKDYSKELNDDLIVMRQKVFDLAGEEFNLDSPRQLGPILFEKMGIPPGKRTKTGQYSTAEDTLSQMRNDHEIIDHILNYRELIKLKSTYVDALPALINPRTGRIHTTFNQTIAATGRLSSLSPNLQNIPIRTERGRRIRKAFIPRDKDHILLAADYSQVELRIIAAITQDEGMLEAFKNREDIHSTTASKVFGVPLEEVDSDMRRKAKAVNFGLAYGQSAFGLSQTLRIKRGEAKEIIENYFAKFPGIKNYMSDTINFAKEHGYVETLLKRRRYLRDINSKNHTVRSQAERNAINSPIQGSAADLIKVAMLEIDKVFKKEKFKSKMLLQVHDELVFDAHKDEIDTIRPIIEEKMKTAIPDLPVPIEVGMGEGHNWLEAH